jgi:hypothetical protein
LHANFLSHFFPRLNVSLNFFLFNLVGWGVGYCCHYWPIVPASGNSDGDSGEIGGMKIGRGNRSTRRKPAPAPMFPLCTFISHLRESCFAFAFFFLLLFSLLSLSQSFVWFIEYFRFPVFLSWFFRHSFIICIFCFLIVSLLSLIPVYISFIPSISSSSSWTKIVLKYYKNTIFIQY